MSDLWWLLALAIALLAVTGWRRALLLSLCVGFVQDVVRKTTPDEPLYMVLLFAPVFAIAALGLLLRGGDVSLRPMFRAHPVLRAPVLAFFAVLAMQVLVTLAHTGSAALAGLGIMVYALPFVALVVSMYFASRLAHMVAALEVYVAMSVVFGAGVYLNVAGYQDGVLDSVGVGLFVYPPEGGVLKLPSGLFRAPEIAAWHCATAAAFAALLIMIRRFPGGPLTGAVVILFLVGAVLLTGRRKMAVELVVFASVFAALLSLYRGRSTRLVALLGCVAAVLFAGQLMLVPGESEVNVRPYVSRFDTVVEEAAGRLRTTTVDSFRWVVERNGVLGAGAGTASQGADRFGGGVQLVGHAAEGGIAKVLAELGVHGLAVALWVAVSAAFACHASIRAAHRGGDWRRALLAVGLASVLCSNLLVFATASQVFGDPFVLLMLGLMLGFVLRPPPGRAAAAGPRAAATPVTG